jgi:large subunit ribosomal protein L6
MVVGVTEGFKKQVKLVGIGYKIIATSESSITLNLGFSHPIEIEIPANINLTAEALKENKADQSQIEFKSTSLVDLNNFVYSIKRIRPINKSFKGTGVTII